MVAVIQTGGKQLRVAEGDTVKVERMDGNVGDSIKIENVLMTGEGKDAVVGTPTLPGVSLTGIIVEQGRDKKIIIFKHKRRKNSRKRRGHRQYYTRLKITGIEQ